MPKEMGRRRSLGKYLVRIEARGSLSSYIGGVRLNHEAGGVIGIEVAVDAPSAQRAAFVREMSAEVPGGDPVTAVTVTHSSEELLGVVERITSDLSAEPLKALGVRTVSTEKGVITIGIDSIAPTTAESALKQRYPESFVDVKRSSEIFCDRGDDFLSGPPLLTCSSSP